MAHVYRTEVTIEGVTVVTPTLSSTQFGTRPAIFISASDDTNVWALEARLAYHAYSSLPVLYELRAEFYAYFAVTYNGDPATGSFVSGTSSIFEADGANGAAITAGFTMAIEKDEALDQLRFVTPLGTLTKTLSAFETPDDSRLRMNGMAHQFVRPNIGSASGSDNFGWKDFFGKENGTNFQGTALTTTDPGSWSGWTDVTFGFPTGPIANNVNAQNATRYDTSFSYTAADGTRSGGSRQWRTWTGGDSLNASGDLVVDMTHAREHGAHWAAYTYPMTSSILNYRRTFDKGASWLEGVIYSAGGANNRSPSITWYYGRLIAVWHDGTSIVQSISSDAGATWGSPVAVIATGTNPRHIIDPAHGVGFYFYFSGTDLLLQRSGDYGASFIDASPITVASGIGTQTIGAAFGPDGSVIVGYVTGGIWTQLRSTDYGRSWS